MSLTTTHKQGLVIASQSIAGNPYDGHTLKSALTKSEELVAYQYDGFWKCMDALRDKIELEELWQSGQAKWKKW